VPQRAPSTSRRITYGAMPPTGAALRHESRRQIEVGTRHRFFFDPLSAYSINRRSCRQRDRLLRQPRHLDLLRCAAATASLSADQSASQKSATQLAGGSGFVRRRRYVFPLAATTGASKRSRAGSALCGSSGPKKVNVRVWQSASTKKTAGSFSP
jgi:hypothetical protein